VSQLDSNSLSVAKTCPGEKCVLLSLMAVLRLTQIKLKQAKSFITYCNFIINIFNYSWHNSCLMKDCLECSSTNWKFFPKKTS